MKFMKAFYLALLLASVLVSGCDPRSNVQKPDKIKSVMGMTKTQVKETLGKPWYARDDVFGYDSIQPDSGNHITCYVWFDNDSTVSSIVC